MALAYTTKINGTTIPKIKTFKVGRNKLWTDAARNMKGELRSTFIGIFPKIKLGFTYLTADEASLIAGLLDNSSFTLEWWDAVSQTYKSSTYYSSDFEMPLYDAEKELYEPFEVTLVPFKKMT